MKNFTTLFLLALLAFAYIVHADDQAPADDDIDESDVVVIKDKEHFEKFKSETEIFVIEFYAPWCGHCKNLRPEYAAAATELKKDNIILAKVDATEARDLSEEHGVQGFPTLKIYNKGTMLDYEGPRDSAGIVAYVKKMITPSYTTVSLDDAKAGLKDDTNTIIYQSAEGESLGLLDQLAKTQVFDGTQIFYVAEAASDENDTICVYSGGADTGDCQKDYDEGWLLDHVVSNTVPIGQEGFDLLLTIGKTFYLVFDDAQDSAKEFTEEVSNEKGVRFMLADQQYSRVAANFGQSGTKFPVAVAVKPGETPESTKMINFNEDDEDLTKESYAAFITAVEKDEYKSYLKSEPIPEVQTDELSFQVVGKTFVSEVWNREDDKDVFMFLFAPWCGHCQALHPTYNSLAGQLHKATDKIVVASMDFTANAVEQEAINQQVTGFPTLLFFPHEKKGEEGSERFVVYEAGRAGKDMVEWIHEKSSHEFEAFEFVEPEPEPIHRLDEDDEDSEDDYSDEASDEDDYSDDSDDEFDEGEAVEYEVVLDGVDDDDDDEVSEDDEEHEDL